MAQMSQLRQKLFGYKLISIKNYNDVSYMTAWEIENISGVPYSKWHYQSKAGKTVTKQVSGHWTLNEAPRLEDDSLKKLIEVMSPVLKETKSYKTEEPQLKLLREILAIFVEDMKRKKL